MRPRSNPGPDDRRSPGRRSHTRRSSRLRTAVHDADRLAPQDRPAAVAGPAGGRGCHDGLRRKAQPRITAITRARCGDRGRTGTSHDVRIARSAHSTHRQEGVPGRRRGLEQRRCCLSPDGNTRPVRGHPSRVPAVPIHQVLRHCSLCRPAATASGVIIAVSPGRITVPGSE